MVGGPVEDVEVVAPVGSFNDYVRGGRFNGVPELVVFLANSTGDTIKRRWPARSLRASLE